MATSPSDQATRFSASNPLDATSGGHPSGPESHWVARQVEAMAAAWKDGEQPNAGEVLAQHPEIGDEAAIRLIYEEVTLRREGGQDVPTSEVVRRYPRFDEPLRVLLSCDRLLRSQTETVAFPEEGERLGDFQLFRELGRGASGRTFLAAQPALADRPVVLKVIPWHHDEHLSLARLQHTHIVPLYSEHTFAELRLRALCMPYLGGVSLAHVLEGVAEIPLDRRQGRQLLDVLDRSRPILSGAPQPGGPFRRVLDRAPYVQSICWIAACLADALQYAHERGLVHMDVKPSNVLIADDGQPMLLDFHLARGPVLPRDPLPERLGGTPDWTSPEQQAAMRALAQGRPIEVAVDGQSDLYSLGLLLVDALGGSAEASDRPFGATVRRRNPRVSVGLADIIDKCTAHTPTDRYPDASALADDLRRHLNDQPLRGVANRSLAERWRKLRRRRPRTFGRGTAPLSTFAAVVLLIILAGVFQSQRIHRIETDLEDGRRLVGAHQYPEAIRCLTRGRDLARLTLLAGKLPSDLDAELKRALRGRNALTLHELAEAIRFRFGVAPAATDDARALARRCRTLWDERSLLLAQPGVEDDPEFESRIHVDLRELAVTWAYLRVRLAAVSEADVARRDALGVLDEARDLFGPSPAVDRERRALAAALGKTDRGPSPVLVPHSAWEHYDLGRSFLRSGEIDAADREFRQTLDVRPQDFWPNFYEGLCAYRLGRYAEAVAAFRVCTALAPTSAECFYNRGLANEALGRADDASRDYTHALDRDQRLAPAALNRGILAYKAGRPQEAVTDFQSAIAMTSNREISARIHYNLALAHLACGDRSAALADAQEAVNLGSLDAVPLRERLLRSTALPLGRGAPGPG